MKRWQIALAILAAFAIGELDPVGSVWWKLAEARLPEIKKESLARPSPFSSIPRASWVGENDDVFAFNDRNHDAPVHILIAPKRRYATILDAPPLILSEMFALALSLARQKHIAQSGFRLVINTNPQGTQSVYHLHLHLIGGRQLRACD